MNQLNSYSHSLYLLLLIYLFQIAINTSSISSGSNKYDTDNDKYWISTSNFKPSRGIRYGGLKRRKSMYFALKFVYYGKTTWNEWENIIRIGEYGNGTDSGCNEHGNRYPALFILPTNNGLQISLSDKSECWFVIEKNYNLIQNIIYNLIINYNETHSTIYMSTYDATTNKIVEPLHIISNKSRTNDNTLLGKFMDIIISDPLTIPANVSLWDIVIISYDDILTFPTESPTIAPTISPSIAPSMAPTVYTPIRPDEDFGVEIQIAMDYNSNNTNKSESDEVIRDVTEDILNNYIHQLSNSSNNNTIIHVIISDIDNKEYDIILKSNYTTNNETATKLEAFFENKLETELLNKIEGIKNIEIEIRLVDRSNDEEQYITTTETTKVLIIYPKNDNDNMSLILSIVIGGCFIMVCIFVIGFCVGRKCNGYSKITSRQIRLESNIGNENDNDNENENNIDINNIGNIQNDCKLTQDSGDENENEYEYSEHAQLGHINESTNDQEVDIINHMKNNIRNDIFEVAMDTPSGIRPINNNELQIVDNVNKIQLNDINSDDDIDIEDMYNYQNTKGNQQLSLRNNNYTNISPRITVEGDGVGNDTVNVVIPHCN